MFAAGVPEVVALHFDEFLLKKRHTVNSSSVEEKTGTSLPLFAKQYNNTDIYELFDNSRGEANQATVIYNNFNEKASSYDPAKTLLSANKNEIKSEFKKLDLYAQTRFCREVLRDVKKKLLSKSRSIKVEIDKKNKKYLARASETNRYLNVIQTALSTNNMSTVMQDMRDIFNDPSVDKGWAVTRFIFGRVLLWYGLHDMIDRSLKAIEKDASTYWLLQPGNQAQLLQKDKEAARDIKKLARQLAEYKRENQELKEN